MKLHRILPRPGPVWGYYPQKPLKDNAPISRALSLHQICLTPRAQSRRVVVAALRFSLLWQQFDAPARDSELIRLRSELQHTGLTSATMAEALGACMVYAEQSLGQRVRPTQCLAAALLLDQRMAEMATGEGKTLALALAAAAAGLAAIPVHVLTANDYLAVRDSQALAPFYAALGLSCAAVPAAGDLQARRKAYASDVVYATAQCVAFDYLRDQQVLNSVIPSARVLASAVTGESNAPVMRGLCMALLDEADSILLDEADVPLVLSQGVNHAARRAFLWQALALARRLEVRLDFALSEQGRSVVLSSEGDARVATWSAGLGGPWSRPRYRREAITLALRALHLFHRDFHYVVREGAIELLDEVTGRIAVGRVWSRGLHTVVAMKEGVTPPPDTQTVAQTGFQRFFQRYWRLGGVSGTLWGARAELRYVFGVAVVRVPLYRANQRRLLPPRCFDSPLQRWQAVAQRASALLATGRPILVGTDSVAESLQLSAVLQAYKISHRVLNALSDGNEAAIIARAGLTGALTVATRMAGRGTDIELEESTRSKGGLHVISCQKNPSYRLDRQLAGRAGRQGDPGSVEFWLLESAVDVIRAENPDTMGLCLHPSDYLTTAWFALANQRLAQWREDRRRSAMRRLLLDQGLQWEEKLAFAGSRHWR